jgi:uncharacterized protein
MCLCQKKPWNCLSIILTLIGGLNWGLIGIGNLLPRNWNLVNLIFGRLPLIETIVYILVGLAALYTTILCVRYHKSCDSSAKKM